MRRVGKNIFIDLSGNPRHIERDKKTIYIHLKMTGHLLVKYQIQNRKSQINHKSKIQNFKQRDYFNDKVNQYIHHIFYLKSQNQSSRSYNKTLEFSDLRKFGKIVLADTDKLESLKEIKSLGIDALSRKFTLKRFKEIFKKRQNSLIGIILMNQNLIAGIGNIYRSEILFDAKILPTRKAVSLKPAEIKSLYGSIKKILKKAVKMRGTSDSDYRDTSGAPGKFQKKLKVYRRDGEKCQKCGSIIKKVKLGQRSAYYCEKCQR